MGRRDDAGCWGGAERRETCREVSVCGLMLLLGGAGGWELAPCFSFPSCEHREPKLRAENTGKGVSKVLGMEGWGPSPH